MAAGRTVFVCQACGRTSPKWLGRCPECGAWDCFAEELRQRGGAKAAAAAGRPVAVIPLAAAVDDRLTRFPAGLELVDRVMGGGLVAGGAVLLAGEPGIGKSTLLLQLGDALARGGRRVLYVSAEESPRQLRLRSERLGCGAPGLLVAGETRLEPLLAAVRSEPPTVLLVDSIQALRSDGLESPPGSIGQLRLAADRLVELAKSTDTALILVGHVTKEGAIAGPKSLEHLVDTVLTFEGEQGSEHRLLRAQKNRFGPTGEVALFAMHDSGLEEVKDPSRVLLSLRRGQQAGSAVLASLQGSRPLLVEVQALLHPTALPAPRRMAVGLDANRLVLLAAVLERFAGLRLADRDLFVNVVGGLSIREPAADLAVAAALLSALADRPLPEGAVFFGEVGLLGEVRPVSRTDARLREAATLGFRHAYLPAGEAPPQTPDGIKALPIADVAELGRRLAAA